MQTEQISLHGYTVKIAQDECPENPFEAWDCEPPLLAYYGSGRNSFRAYNEAPCNWWDVLRALPASVFHCKNRVAFLRRFVLQDGDSLREYAEDKRRIGDLDAMAERLGDAYGEKPHGWGSASEWLETAAAILEYGGITCHFTESHGYCQGNSTLLLAVATQEWRDKAGFTPGEPLPDGCLESACELHGQWQWGDVYGVASIEDENGEEIPDGSCWGFYGSNHEKSGLLDHARNAIQCHERHQKQEAENFTAALCSLE